MSSMELNPPLPQEIEVTVLLLGGHSYTVALAPDAPLLRQLFEAALGGSEAGQRELFQLPINRGRSVVSFRGDRVVGLVTDPPILLQPNSPPTMAASHPEIIPSTFLHLDNFFTAEEHSQLLEYVMAREAEFVPTSTSTGDLDYRRSVVLYAFPEYEALISERIHSCFADVLSKLNLPPFAIAQVEAQLTAHNDGNYYKVHNDNGSPETATRELTYVYYFYREPRAFSGGELVIYDSKVEGGYYVQADSSTTVEPRNNSIVFFPSRYMHEVLSVRCPSRQFQDSRFTINGWVRRP